MSNPYAEIVQTDTALSVRDNRRVISTLSVLETVLMIMTDNPFISPWDVKEK